MPRIFVFSCAFVIGWIVYMIGMVMTMTVYEGMLLMVYQPIIGAACSGIALAVAMIVGLIFQIPPVGKFWRATPVPSVLLAVGSLFILCCGSWLGLRQTYVDPETQQQMEGLRTEVAVTAYFVLVFAIAHWPFTGQPRGWVNGGPVRKLVDL